MNSPDFLQILIAALIMGSLTAYLAKGRGRDTKTWFFVGFLCGIFGLIALFFYPPVEQKAKQEPVAPPKPVEDALAAKSWYYLDKEHATIGPQPLDVLQTLFKEQKITPRTYIWCEGMEGWKRLEELPELFARF